jgi:hypothetical protein
VIGLSDEQEEKAVDSRRTNFESVLDEINDGDLQSEVHSEQKSNVMPNSEWSERKIRKCD